MFISNEKLKQLLVEPGHIGEADFDSAQQESKDKGIPIERYLVERGLIADKYLGKTIADGTDYHFIDLSATKIEGELLGLIPEVVAKSQQAIFFERSKDKLKLATANPQNYEFIKSLEKTIDLATSIEVYYATPTGLSEAFRYYKSDLAVQAKALIDDLSKNPENEENIVKLVNIFLEYAHDNRASDIHIEPLENSVSVRFRIDGVLHEAATYPLTLHDKLVFRVKIMASLRTDEHKAAQDGRFDYAHGDASFDVRVSILPVTDGENVVLRLLAESARRLSLTDLGLLEGDLDKVKRAATKPHGMILAVGPTGSGKTTSLYAILQILNQPAVNIMTIEDPVEYDMAHVQQTQVNAKKQLTFATGLRSIVRQDPDIIMVGEIRDNETADIAINASMTGHLLLSTLHANDAATTFPRLLDMNIEPFLLSSSVNVVLSQRLVRKICEKCRMSYTLGSDQQGFLKANPSIGDYLKKKSNKKDLAKINFYKGTGCRVCGDTGYAGRTAIFEVMEIGEELRKLITGKVASDELGKKAKELGMTSMLEDGITKVIQGITTIDEVMRATKI
jgi:type II secretory ATPase GspE/PulE/Tfp pilus assembly ATPase PilB-like protein